MIKKLSVTEYAKLREITRQGVVKAMKSGNKMLGVKKWEMIGSTYILYVDMAYFKEIIKN